MSYGYPYGYGYPGGYGGYSRYAAEQQQRAYEEARARAMERSIAEAQSRALSGRPYDAMIGEAYRYAVGLDKSREAQKAHQAGQADYVARGGNVPVANPVQDTARGYEALRNKYNDLLNRYSAMLQDIYGGYKSAIEGAATAADKRFAPYWGAYSELKNRTMTAPSRLERWQSRVGSYERMYDRFFRDSVEKYRKGLLDYKESAAKQVGEMEARFNPDEMTADELRRYNELRSGYAKWASAAGTTAFRKPEQYVNTADIGTTAPRKPEQYVEREEPVAMPRGEATKEDLSEMRKAIVASMPKADSLTAGPVASVSSSPVPEVVSTPVIHPSTPSNVPIFNQPAQPSQLYKQVQTNQVKRSEWDKFWTGVKQAVSDIFTGKIFGKKK